MIPPYTPVPAPGTLQQAQRVINRLRNPQSQNPSHTRQWRATAFAEAHLAPRDHDVNHPPSPSGPSTPINTITGPADGRPSLETPTVYQWEGAFQGDDWFSSLLTNRLTPPNAAVHFQDTEATT